MARPSYGDLPRQVVAAATRLLDRAGPQAVTHRAVAAEAGVAVSTIRHRFGSLAGLLDDVARAGFGELTAHLVALDDPRPRPPQLLDELADRYRRWALAHPDRHRLMFGGPTLGLAPSPLTRRAAADLLALFEIGAGDPATGRARLEAELGAVQLELSDLIPAGRPPT